MNEKTPDRNTRNRAKSEILPDYSHTHQYNEMEDDIKQSIDQDEEKEKSKSEDESKIPENQENVPKDNLPDLVDIKQDLLDETEMAQINTLNEPVTVTIVNKQ